MPQRQMLIMVAALSVLLASCRGEEGEPAPAPPAAAATAQAEGAVIVRDEAGKQLFSVSAQTDGVVEIAFTAEGEQRVLRGEPRESGKRKYRIGSSAVMFEVKPGDDDSFKLRMADGALRWKVKVSADKIKVSDNEENANAFELKPRESSRVKVEAPGGKELGNVRGNDVEDAAGKKVFRVEGPAGSAAYGVLLLDRVPELHRYILVAELLSRGK